jgi:hypothetical protein
VEQTCSSSTRSHSHFLLVHRAQQRHTAQHPLAPLLRCLEHEGGDKVEAGAATHAVARRLEVPRATLVPREHGGDVEEGERAVELLGVTVNQAALAHAPARA